ncbi:hypothetical protein BU17DRAFT_50491 [Hysterangium stoloniferum]|nr:hypothetical protein BU17DRAFT_50491 [Hysterangium stoloniferum]
MAQSTAPPPPPPSRDIDSSVWELPEIPSGSFSMPVGGGLGLASSISSEDSTNYPTKASTSPPPPESVTPRPSSIAPPRPEPLLSGEELIRLWNMVGTNVHKAATALFERSKKTVVGDGTNQGFVNAVLEQVPQASKVSHGHLVYAQTGNVVSRRSSNIMPGDVVELIDAKLKGHKGLQSYHQSAGTLHEPLVGIVSEFDAKKSKIKVLQANQHVGSQAMEMVSYRLDDLKSGNAKIFRVAHG